MVAQTNDTGLHQWTRKRVIELQAAVLIRKAHQAGGGFVTLTKEENTDIFVEVLSNFATYGTVSEEEPAVAVLTEGRRYCERA